MLLDERELLDRAYAHYEAWARLRTRENARDEVRHSRHPIPIPESMASRTQPVYSFLAGGRVERAKDLLIDPNGPMVLVMPYGSSNKAGIAKDVVQEWLTGIIQYCNEESANELHPNLTEDNLIRSRAYLKILPYPQAWNGLPDIRDQEDEEDDDSYSQYVSEQTKKHEKVKQRQPPIYACWVPARSVIPLYDHHGLSEVYEITQMSVEEVLATYVDYDDDGEPRPLATELLRANERSYLTTRDVCTVIIRADREHVQVATAGFIVDQIQESRGDFYQHNVEQLILEYEHHMDAVPYAEFPGRTTTADDPVLRYNGFLNPIENLVRRLDEALTQMHSSGRTAAWPSLVLEKTADAIGSGDRPAPIEIPEGGVTELAQGEKLVNPEWTNSSDYMVLRQSIDMIRREIDLHTFPDSAYGTTDVNSGYLQAQLQAAAEQVLGPFAKGLSLGWRRACKLFLRAAAAIMDEGFGSIPVRYTSSEGMKYVTLKKEHVDIDWVIKVDVRPRPVGGEAALAQTLSNEVQNGWISNQTAMERIGIRNATREQRRLWIERVMASPTIAQFIEQEVIKRAIPLLANQQAPGLPESPQIPGALAQNLTDPSLTGRLPEMPAAQGAMAQPPLGGNPNQFAQDAAPPPPALTDRVVVGNAPGNAQALPGGLNRQSELISRRG